LNHPFNISQTFGLTVSASLFGLFLTAASALATDQRDIQSDFQELVELAPYEVADEQLSISVFARSRGDRKYAVRFAEEVVDHVFGTLEKSTGYGLVIVGDKREPHPMFVFQMFLEMALEKRIHPALQPAAGELEAMIKEWEEKIEMDEDDGAGDDDFDLEFETLIPAIPLPLEGVASKLYQIAWVESFDEAQVEQRLEALTLAELESDELSAYDWVFFLPHKGALSDVIGEVLPQYMEQTKVNIFQAAAMRAAVFAFKPLIKGAFERIRKGMLFMTVLRSQSEYSESDIDALLETYIQALKFDGRKRGQTERAFVLQKIETQKAENAYLAAHPFVAPKPLDQFDLDFYETFEGKYAKRKKATHRFFIKGGLTYWQYLERDPRLFYPAGDSLLVNEEGDMTIEFLWDEKGKVSGVMERWKDRRNKIPHRLK